MGLRSIAVVIAVVTGILAQQTSALVNIAANKPAYQSGTYLNASASRAVDGNTAWDFFNDGSCTHTPLMTNPYWGVDLNGLFTVQSVTVHNRLDCCSERLSGFKVRVADALNQTVEICESSPSDMYGEAVATVQCSGPIVGRYVEVFVEREESLTLCEVEVWSPGTEIFPCDTNNGGCATDISTCASNAGVVACTCDAGYTGNGYNCTDIDECAEATDTCDGTRSNCSNTIGGFTCTCKAGWEQGASDKLCSDINECTTTSNGGCIVTADCANTPGSRTCTCKTGYTGDGSSCSDIDECDAATDTCDSAKSNCSNTVGGFTCTCKAGYEQGASNKLCADINECTATVNGGCDLNANCTNTAGSQTCTCKSGYTGDGSSCSDFDECNSTATNICPANADCLNKDWTGIYVGTGYKCVCKAGYTGNGINCTEILVCTEAGMTFYHSFDTLSEYVNLIKQTSWQSEAVQRFRTRSGDSVTRCGTVFKSSKTLLDTVRMNYTDCADTAISIVQVGNVIKREAVMEIQLNANALDPVLRHLNYTKYKLTCEYERQINASNSFNVSVTATVQELIETEVGTFDVDMDLYDSALFSVKSSSPKQVAIGEPLYVELHKTHNDTNLKMVVDDCWATDTADQSGEFKYFFLNDGCGLDSTFVNLREDASHYHFKIDAFVFIRLKSQIYLHCNLYVCDVASSVAKCQQGCQSRKRKRRFIEETRNSNGDIAETTSNRERRAVTTAPLAVGKAVSSMIQFTPKTTCAVTSCPANSACAEGYPAFCRCNDNYVMDTHTKQCTDERLVEMKVPTNSEWYNQFKDKSSIEFLIIARLLEGKMLDYYVTQRKVMGISGIKIASARNNQGGMELRVMMILSQGHSLEGVSQQIETLMATEPQQLTDTTSMNPYGPVLLAPVHMPAVQSEKTTKGTQQTWSIGVAVGAGVLVFLLVVFAYFIKRSKMLKQVPIDIQGMEMSKE